MDLSQAFDCIPHGILITKMSAYGLGNKACEFMASYLSEKYQRVKISNNRSSWTPLLKGIPQGSCFSPFLFNVLMNDIFYFIEICDFANYADDNTLDHTASTIESLKSSLQKDTTNAIKWFKENYIQVNCIKFQFMFMKKYTSKEISPEFLNVNDIKILAEIEVKLLDMTIDNKLKFDKHVDKLCKSAARQLMFYIDLEESLTLKKKKLCIMHSFFQISITVPLYGISAEKLHLKKLKIFKKEPYVLSSMIKSVHMNPF